MSIFVNKLFHVQTAFTRFKQTFICDRIVFCHDMKLAKEILIFFLSMILLSCTLKRLVPLRDDTNFYKTLHFMTLLELKFSIICDVKELLK